MSLVAPPPQNRDVRPERTPRPSRHLLGGLINRKERWGLSAWGWLSVVLLLLVAATGLVWTIFPFLAVTRPVDADVMVVEGWVPQYVMQVAANDFYSGHYKRAFTTGGPIRGMGGYTNDYNTSASVGAGLLRKAGLPEDVVQMAPSRVINRDRTYTSALALRAWFDAHDFHPRAINVITEGPHARRTWLLFQKAFGDTLQVGIVSVPSPDYDAKHWWRYSESVRDIIDEVPAYLYAKFIFSAKSD